MDNNGIIRYIYIWYNWNSLDINTTITLSGLYLNLWGVLLCILPTPTTPSSVNAKTGRMKITNHYHSPNEIVAGNTKFAGPKRHLNCSVIGNSLPTPKDVYSTQFWIECWALFHSKLFLKLLTFILETNRNCLYKHDASLVPEQHRHHWISHGKYQWCRPSAEGVGSMQALQSPWARDIAGPGGWQQGIGVELVTFWAWHGRERANISE